jgi:hypothetical protein
VWVDDAGAAPEIGPAMPRRTVTRHLVLDNEAASALLSTEPHDARRARVIEGIAAANGRRLVPTAVRGETGWDRTDPAAANANRLMPTDDPLDRPGADRVAQLRAAVPHASVVDAAAAVAAERAGVDGGVVELLTSDVTDLTALAAHVSARIDIVRI